MLEVVKFAGDDTTLGTRMDTADTKEDALILAQLYAEEHFKRIMPDRGQLIGAVFNHSESNPLYQIVGYRFVTNNGTIVTYTYRSV